MPSKSTSNSKKTTGRGLFIVLEGPDYSGKTTQTRLLAGRLEKETGRLAHILREPGGTELGEALRSILKSKIPIARPAEIYLFLAARVQLLLERIKPILEKGEHVVLDRFESSTIVYQAAARGIPVAEILPLFRRVRETGVQPDLEVRLDVSWSQIQARMEASRDDGADPRFEDIDFLKKVHAEYHFAGYSLFASNYGDYVTPWEISTICPADNMSAAEVASEIWGDIYIRFRDLLSN